MEQPLPPTEHSGKAFVKNLRNYTQEGKISGLFDLLHSNKEPLADQAQMEALKRNALVETLM